VVALRKGAWFGELGFLDNAGDDAFRTSAVGGRFKCEILVYVQIQIIGNFLTTFVIPQDSGIASD
jgi:hypothetical protein